MTEAATTVPVQDVTTQPIPIAEIYIGENHRVDRPDDLEAIEQLMRDINARGVLQPIRVHQVPEEDRGDFDGKPYVIAYGRRRVEASRRLELETIRADVAPPATAAEIEAESAIENLGRQDLTPVEEALAVDLMLKSVNGSIPDAAAALGRPSKWVWDRAYIRDVGDDVKKLLVSGHLLLGHARELAKVKDPKEQLKMARDAAGCAYNSSEPPEDGAANRWSVSRLARHVEASKRSLRLVIWKVDQPFANKPACTDCPDNTSADATLYGIDADDKGNGYCMNGACFDAKQKSAEKSQLKAIEKVVKKKDAGAAAVDKLRPPHLKRGPIQRQAKKQLEPADTVKKAAKGSDSKSSKKAKLTPEQQAMGKYAEVMDEWIDTAREAIVEKAKKSPLQMLLLYTLEKVLADSLDPPKGKTYGGWSATESRYEYGLSDRVHTKVWEIPELTPKASGLISALQRGDAKPIVGALMEFERDIDMDFWNVDPIAFRQLALALEVAVDDYPKWDDFKPADPGAADVGDEKAPAKTTKKKSTKKKTVRKKKTKAKA